MSLFSFWPESPVFLQPIPGLTTVVGRSFQGQIGTRAVWAGVPETYLKKSFLGLNVSLAVGPPVFAIFARKESASHHFRIDLDTF